jgi:allophanate hydrolase
VSVFVTKIDEPDGDGPRLAVKDNIDVAGVPTTAAHPGFAYTPARSATVVERLVAAGYRVIGKTNLDQFATGLVGTRSPYGIVANPVVPGRVAGGSSSGSAVAVATGAADIALGTDTAGSGRVPAALCGVIGLKPTRGLLSAAGVVPAVPSLDCVTVFARSVSEAAAAAGMAAGFDDRDPRSRHAPAGTPPVGAGRLRLGVPSPADLDTLDADAARAWAVTLARLGSIGEVTEIDMTPYFNAGELVYGAFVAERVAAVGEFVASHPEGADPAVAAILSAGARLSAASVAADLDSLPGHRAAARKWWNNVDAVVVPTVPEAPTLEQVAADPLGVNARLGRFTLGANPLDLCGIAVPSGHRDDGVPFGVTFLGPAFADAVVAAGAARLAGEAEPAAPPWAATATVVVVGAHLRGQPLNHQLVDLGATFLGEVRTAGAYRLFALATEPPKPGLVRVPASESGHAIAAELWAMPADSFGAFVRGIPSPLGIGTITLSDGTSHQGFVCEAWATAGAADITAFGGWAAYLASSR